MTTTETQVAIVGCGKAKRDGRHKARNLYTSTYFDKKRLFAEVGCDDWFILSAKYGLIDPDRRVPSYDVTVTDVDADEFATRVADQADANADVFDAADRVFVLAGKDYIDAVDDVLAGLPCEVEYPFAGTGGIGDQMSVLDDMTPPLRPHDYRRQTAYRSPVDVYSVTIGSGISLRYNWPYKLIRVEHVTANNVERIRESCETIIVDSGIGNPDITNEDVLDTAAKVDAEYVVPKDFIGEQDRTTESAKEFLDLYADHECDAEYFIPLQPPHHKHATDFPDEDRYTIGGIKNDKPDEQIAAIRKTRDVVGDDAYLHALGMGASRRIIDTLREEPALLDSMDTATPEFAPAKHRTPDKSLVQKTGGFLLPGGDDTSTGKAIASELILWQMAHMLNPDWRGDGNEQDGTQAAVEAFL